MKWSRGSQVAADNVDMKAAKTAKAAAEEGKAHVEGDLATMSSTLGGCSGKLATASANRMASAAGH